MHCFGSSLRKRKIIHRKLMMHSPLTSCLQFKVCIFCKAASVWWCQFTLPFELYALSCCQLTVLWSYLSWLRQSGLLHRFNENPRWMVHKHEMHRWNLGYAVGDFPSLQCSIMIFTVWCAAIWLPWFMKTMSGMWNGLVDNHSVWFVKLQVQYIAVETRLLFSVMNTGIINGTTKGDQDCVTDVMLRKITWPELCAETM